MLNPLGGAPPLSFEDRIRMWGERSATNAVSPAGARGTMQVMPGTIGSPGFGVLPAKDNSIEEIDRVGRDYARALLAHYQSEPLAAAAYNAGPGRVNEWLAAFGDPRKGQIDLNDWIGKIPFKETQDYVPRVMGGGKAMGSLGPNALQAGSPDLSEFDSLKGLGNEPKAAAPTPDPLLALHLLRLVTPKTHSLQPVDYDPFKPGLPGAPTV